MVHFPSTLQQGLTSRSEGPTLNATQQKPSTHPIFVQIEEELHDAQRVYTDGQEDDLRYALNMVINRVTELSSMLSEAYKVQAELEIQLNVAKSNLKLVIANNEMLEDALKQSMSARSKEIGWNRTNSRSSGESKEPQANSLQSQSIDVPNTPQAEPSASPPISASSFSSIQDNRFFRFRFNTSSISLTRPSSPNTSHLTSPSLPSLPSAKLKEIESLTAELEKEKASGKRIKEEKVALEAELESLSQALFEEANKMVSDERRLRAEIEEELKELKLEKEALQSALRLVAGEDNIPLVTSDNAIQSTEDAISVRSSHSLASSRIGIKSRPQSLDLALLYPLPSSPAPEELPSWQEEILQEVTSVVETNGPSLSSAGLEGSESEPTPRFAPRNSGAAVNEPFVDESPWADVVSSSPAPIKS